MIGKRVSGKQSNQKNNKAINKAPNGYSVDKQNIKQQYPLNNVQRIQGMK